MAKQNIYDNEIFLQDIRELEIMRRTPIICLKCRLCFP